MTSEERETYLDELYRSLKDVIGQDLKMGVTRTEDDYLEYCMEQKFYIYTHRHLLQSRQKAMAEWRSTVLELTEELRTYIRKQVMEGKKRLMKKEINSVSAKCILSERLLAEGIPFHIDYQTYRAKVHVKLTDSRKAVIYLNYKALHKNLDDFVETVHQLQSIVKKFGKFTTVGKISSYENWEE